MVCLKKAEKDALCINAVSVQRPASSSAHLNTVARCTYAENRLQYLRADHVPIIVQGRVP